MEKRYGTTPDTSQDAIERQKAANKELSEALVAIYRPKKSPAPSDAA